MRPSAQSKSGLGCFDPDLIDIYWFAFTKWSWPLGPQPNLTKSGVGPKVPPYFYVNYRVGLWGPPHFSISNEYRRVVWTFGVQTTFVGFGCGPQGHDHFVKANQYISMRSGSKHPRPLLLCAEGRIFYLQGRFL